MRNTRLATFLIAWVAVSLTAVGTASAEMCGKCKGMMFTMDVGKCAECGGFTGSGSHKLCRKCSARLGQCEHCRTPLAAEKKPTAVNGMAVALEHPARFYADQALAFTLTLKNVSKGDRSFTFTQGIGGTKVGKMTWEIKDVANGSIWKVGRHPNPGPAPGAPVMMGRKTLKPGESFKAAVRVLGWGQQLWQGGTAAAPKRAARMLPPGKYVASLSSEVRGAGQGAWAGSFTVKSREFEVSGETRPDP